MRHLVPVLLATPWIVAPLVTVIRARHSRSLDDERGIDDGDAPLVSLVIPARNEARNIARCARSALDSAYPRLEVLVVDDHSTDDTGAIAAAIAPDDARLRVVTPAPLPDGWFGKQWACAAGANEAAGDIIGFLDADTWQAPDLVPRVIAAMRSRGVDMLSVAGDQEMESFWERLIQPHLFGVILARFGGTESVNRSRHASGKIANGQCIFVRRAAYEALGGHGAVRDKVAEDLALAQRFFTAGYATALVLGTAQLKTRMYTSLAEVVAGWSKNIYAGGMYAMPFGAVGRSLYPVVLLLPGLIGLLPALMLALALMGVASPGVLVWASIATAGNLGWWLLVYRFLKLSPMYALLHPLGSAMLLYMSVVAVARGRRVRWKDREYRAV